MAGSAVGSGRRRRKPSSARWLARQARDSYSAAARREGYRSRAAYKLLDIEKRFGVLPRRGAVVDLGCAPGSWCQVASRRGCAPLVGVDLVSVEAIEGARFVAGDLREESVRRRVLECCESAPRCVLSDMAAPATGQRSVDRLRMEALAEAAVEFALESLAPGGCLVVKLLGTGAMPELRGRLARQFDAASYYKPAASRIDSSEIYLVARSRRAASLGIGHE